MRCVRFVAPFGCITDTIVAVGENPSMLIIHNLVRHD